jgi:26S proteasome non-ATPase regulatory subunit 10
MMLGVTTVTDGMGSIPIASTGGRTALHFAASRGNDTCVTALLPHAITANIRDKRDNVGCTPLYSALLAGHNDTARIIDPAAAPVTVITPPTNTLHMPLHIVIICCGINIVGN